MHRRRDHKEEELPWPREPAQWNTSYHTISMFFEDRADMKEKRTMSVKSFNKRCDRAPIPLFTIRCKYLLTHHGIKAEHLHENINTTKCIIHEYTLKLVATWLHFKKRVGTPIERYFYCRMNIFDMLNRLLRKRAIACYGAEDNYYLTNGCKGKRDLVFFSEEITTPAILHERLSHDEIKLSALLGISSRSYFVNKGNKSNGGVVNMDRNEVEELGVMVGLSGPRLDREFMFEYREIVKSKRQNVQPLGYLIMSDGMTQQLFSSYYDEVVDTFEQLRYRGEIYRSRYIRISEGEYFDTLMYMKRLAIIFDMLLIEANLRAKDKNKMAFVHVVPIGLPNSKVVFEQDKYFLAAFGNRIKFYGPELANVSDVCFTYMNQDNCLGFKNGDKIPIPEHPLGGITVHFKNRNPFDKLTGPHEGKLLVVSYEANSNAVAGNEFWLNSFNTSQTAGMACASQISELHNPHINQQLEAKYFEVFRVKDGVINLIDFVEKIAGVAIKSMRDWERETGNVMIVEEDLLTINFLNQFMI